MFTLLLICQYRTPTAGYKRIISAHVTAFIHALLLLELSSQMLRKSSFPGYAGMLKPARI